MVVWFPCLGTAGQECSLSGMFPSGSLSGQDEPHKSEQCPASPKNGDLQKTNPKVEQREQRACPPEDSGIQDLLLVDSKANFGLSEDGSSGSSLQDGTDEDSVPKLKNQILDEEGEEGSKQGSGNIVEHLLKELKGINKIQEEISDLRQYLTSVRGSVDEVSCCVDAVLSEIEELYSGASAAPHPSPVSQRSNIRRGSLGRQNAITSPHGGCLPSYISPKQWHIYRVALQSSQKTNKEDLEQKLGPEKHDLCYLELQNHQGCQSTSSLSSCLSPSFLSDADRWPSFSLPNSVSGEGGWSEEDIYSANSIEELRNCPGVWDRCATEETESSTPGSQKSSERLSSSVFGPYYNTPSSSSSTVDSRPPRAQNEEAKFEFHCSPNCPYSGSSGYHAIDAGPNELCSEPFRSPSCSTVLLTDCDDGYLVPTCDDCPSFGDTLKLGSADSLGREWTDPSTSGDEAEKTLSQDSSAMDPDGAKTPSNAGFDITTFSKAVLTFRSALKGALKKLEVTEPDDVNEDCGCEGVPSTARLTRVQKQDSVEDTDEEVDLKESCPLNEDGDDKDSVYLPTTNDLPCSIQASPQEPRDFPCTSCSPVGKPQHKGESPSEVELCDPDSTADHSTERRTESAPGADELRLSPIREHQIPDEVNLGRPTDAGHRERIANFQRILREKRQTRHRLSKSTPGSQGSHGSQGSQGSQSLDEFIAGI